MPGETTGPSPEQQVTQANPAETSPVEGVERGPMTSLNVGTPVLNAVAAALRSDRQLMPTGTDPAAEAGGKNRIPADAPHALNRSDVFGKRE
jgi:hypothetical protein